MIRRLYEWLIRSHPDRFRRRFGEQMLSIFDDSTGAKSGLHLLTDAFVSLLRQRLLRTERSRAEQLQKNASRVNLAWTVGALGWYVIVAALVHPGPRHGHSDGKCVLYSLYTSDVVGGIPGV